MDHQLSRLYQPGLALLTDLYQVSMAYGYWKSGHYQRDAIFQLYFRKAPFGGQYAIAAGLELVVDYLSTLQFTVEDIQYLGHLKGYDGHVLFDDGFMNHLQRMEFSCSLDAVPEGTVVFPYEPLLRVRGPLVQVQLIESALLNLVNFQTLIATKAHRIVKAAGKQPVYEFGLRRAQGIDGSISASRAAFIGGCQATSNVLASRIWRIPVKGTHGHSWVMSFGKEEEAFQAFAKASPNNCILLVDTYDSVEGIKNAVQTGLGLKSEGYHLLGVRLDSGDLAALSNLARQMLDAAGLHDTKVIASNDLDEHSIRALQSAGAKVDIWGVGTRLVTGFDEAALGGVYKMAAIAHPEGGWDFPVKKSDDAEKRSLQGVHQVNRLFREGLPVADVLWDTKGNEEADFQTSVGDRVKDRVQFDHSVPLLQPVLRQGKLVTVLPGLRNIQEKAMSDSAKFEPYATSLYPILKP